MARNGRKVETWKHPEYGVEIIIRLTADGEFLADHGDTVFKDSTLSGMRAQLKKITAGIDLDVRRFWVAENPDGSSSCPIALNCGMHLRGHMLDQGYIWNREAGRWEIRAALSEQS